jgi:hypothetical protein
MHTSQNLKMWTIPTIDSAPYCRAMEFRFNRCRKNMGSAPHPRTFHCPLDHNNPGSDGMTFRQITRATLVALCLDLVAWPQTTGSQELHGARFAEILADSALRLAQQQKPADNPAAMKPDDAERQAEDAEQQACAALKSAYDRCNPACADKCDAIYRDARRCSGVSSRCK